MMDAVNKETREAANKVIYEAVGYETYDPTWDVTRNATRGATYYATDEATEGALKRFEL